MLRLKYRKIGKGRKCGQMVKENTKLTNKE